MAELKEQISSQDNTKKGNKSNQPVVEEGKDEKLLNQLLGQTKCYVPCEDNINTEEIIESNEQLVHNNISKSEQATNMQMNREGTENNNMQTKPLIEEILSNENDSQTKLTEGIFNFKETKPDIKKNKIEELFYLSVQRNAQQTCLKNNSDSLIKELTGEDEETNLISGLKSENKDNLQTDIPNNKLVEEIFNEESCALSKNQDLCNKVEEIVNNTEVNNKTETNKTEGKLFSEVLLQSGQFEEEITSKQCFNKRKTLEHGLFDNKPLKLKKVEAKEDISIKKYGNSYDLFGLCHDQSATNDLSIAAKDDLRHIESILSPNNSVECGVSFENTTSIELKQTEKETLSSLSFKLLEENSISSGKSVPLNEFKIKSSCVTLADWQRLVYNKSNNNEEQFILNKEQTELRSNEMKYATDVGSDISDSDSYSDIMKRGELCANRCLERMFKTNLIKIGKVTEMFSSLPNIAAEIKNCNSQENKITSCSLPNICQSLILEDFPHIKKEQFKRSYGLFPELCGAKTKRAFEYNVVISELKPEIDVSEVRENFSSNIVQDEGLIKTTTREIKNENSLSPAEKDLNYDQLNPVNKENTYNNEELIGETDTKQTIETNNVHGEELEDGHMSLATKESENEENTVNEDPQVTRYINRSLELQMASSQSKTITNDEL